MASQLLATNAEDNQFIYQAGTNRDPLPAALYGNTVAVTSDPDLGIQTDMTDIVVSSFEVHHRSCKQVELLRLEPLQRRLLELSQ